MSVPTPPDDSARQERDRDGSPEPMDHSGARTEGETDLGPPAVVITAEDVNVTNYYWFGTFK